MPDYISSPDMAAFTIGRVVIAALTTGYPLTNSRLLARLRKIAAGNTKDIPAGVNAEMALGALRYLTSLNVPNKANDPPANRT